MSLIHFVRRGSKLRIMAGDTPFWITNNARASYIKQVCLSAPLWAHINDFRSLQEQAVWLTEMTGELHVLDHIIPVNHPHVCGLTVPWNLQVLHWRVNSAKSNHWNPDQLAFEF